MGLVGAGAFAERHLLAHLAAGAADVVAITDPDGVRAQELARAFEIPHVFADHEAMLTAVELDALTVVSAEHAHVAPTIASLRRGVPVLLEKPVAVTVDEAMALQRVSEETGVLLMPGHILRFASPYRALRDAVRRGEVGEILAVVARRDRTVAIAEHYRNVHPAFLTAVHDIDLVLWLTGGRALRVRALQRSRTTGQPELVLAQVELDSGVVASVSTAYLAPSTSPFKVSDRFDVYGSAGVASVDLSLPPVMVQGSRVWMPDVLLAPDHGPGALAAELSHFCAAVRSGSASTDVPVADAVEGVRIAHAVVVSAGAGGRVVEMGHPSPAH